MPISSWWLFSGFSISTFQFYASLLLRKTSKAWKVYTYVCTCTYIHTLFTRARDQNLFRLHYDTRFWTVLNFHTGHSVYGRRSFFLFFVWLMSSWISWIGFAICDNYLLLLIREIECYFSILFVNYYYPIRPLIETLENIQYVPIAEATSKVQSICTWFTNSIELISDYNIGFSYKTELYCS